jgi:hypothetical protein
MNSFRADTLRFIRPFLSRAATVDLRGAADDLAVFVAFIRTVLVEDDFDDFEEDEDFCADALKGNKSRRQRTANRTCLIMRPPNTLDWCSELSETGPKLKRQFRRSTFCSFADWGG